MLGPTHTIFAMGLAYTLGGSMGDIALVGITARFPDGLEKFEGISILKHRGLTHELLFWLIPTIVFFSLLKGQSYSHPGVSSAWASLTPPILHSFVVINPLWLFAGPLLHLLGDSLTPAGIKVFNMKVSFAAFVTGSYREHLFSMLFTFGCVAFFYYLHPVTLPSVNLSASFCIVLIPAFICRVSSAGLKRKPIVVFNHKI